MASGLTMLFCIIQSRSQSRLGQNMGVHCVKNKLTARKQTEACCVLSPTIIFCSLQNPRTATNI